MLAEDLPLLWDLTILESGLFISDRRLSATNVAMRALGLFRVAAWSWVEAANLLLFIIPMCQEACASYLMENLSWDSYSFCAALMISTFLLPSKHIRQERTNGHGALGTRQDLLFQVSPDIFSLFSLPTVPAIISLDRKGLTSLFQGKRYFHTMKPLILGIILSNSAGSPSKLASLRLPAATKL